MSESSDDVKTATVKKKVLIDASVSVEFPYIERMSYRYKTVEDKAKALEVACRDFQEFLRDHRSQDIVYLCVERTYADICSECEAKFEEWIDDGVHKCANCGTCIVEVSNVVLD